MWKLKRFRHQVTLPVNEIKGTNDLLDEEYVGKLVRQLRSGRIKSTDLDPLLVDVIFGEGYFGHDGSHRLEAFKQAGVKTVRAELQRVVRTPPESL
jgi:uncharacterized ParB-like nuclease family protein